jgi:hypothetical protein
MVDGQTTCELKMCDPWAGCVETSDTGSRIPCVPGGNECQYGLFMMIPPKRPQQAICPGGDLMLTLRDWQPNSRRFSDIDPNFFWFIHLTSGDRCNIVHYATKQPIRISCNRNLVPRRNYSGRPATLDQEGEVASVKISKFASSEFLFETEHQGGRRCGGGVPSDYIRRLAVDFSRGESWVYWEVNSDWPDLNWILKEPTGGTDAQSVDWLLFNRTR